jgi:hypothetical protein
MPKVIQRAQKKYWTSAVKPLYDHDNSLYSRCKLVKGNFFKTIPTGADCNIIKNVILNWDDESAALILKNCLHAMKKTSLTNLYPPGTQRSHPKLLIIETIMPEGNAPFFGKFTDILMLILTRGGRLRTEAELIKLLSSCGFDIVSITKPPDNVSFLSIVEAIPSEEQR